MSKVSECSFKISNLNKIICVFYIIQSFLMDDSNGNGLFAKKISSTNGASSIQLPSSMSSDDLSQSLSEYTDADESISAPTEFLAEVSQSYLNVIY